MKKLLETLAWWANNYKVVAASKLQTSGTLPPDQVAQESYNYWSGLTKNPVQTFALLGNEDGETSFILGVVGDKKTGGAHGIFQWHQARIDAIKKGCGIDITTASHADQLKAAYWEMNHAQGYSHVWANLTACTTIKDAVTVLVRDYERSGMQDRDIARRTSFAEAWQKKFSQTTDKKI